MFSEIEEASGKDVALMSFTHSQSTKVSNLNVEALDLPAISQVVQRLNSDESSRWHIANYRLQPQTNPPTIQAEVVQK